MKKSPHKAVILLGFDSPERSDSACTASQDNMAVQTAVKEALAAGLKELIFVTADSLTPVESQVGSFGETKPERVVIARQFAARSLGQALCEIRHLLEEEPFVVLLPGAMAAAGDESCTARLVAGFAANGGSLVTVRDESVLERDGRFAAIARAAAGRYLLQPAVLDVLEEDPDGGLAGALLLLAEAWPVTALPAEAACDSQVPLRASEAPSLRAQRPAAVAGEMGLLAAGAAE